MNHYVYEITNLVNGKKYIGKRSCKCPIEEDKYMGSGVNILRAIKKYGKENFKKKVLEICLTEEDAYKSEIEHIIKFNAFEDRNYYNLTQGGEGFTSDTLKLLWQDDHFKHKMLTHLKSKEFREKQSLRSKSMWQDENFSLINKKKFKERTEKLWKNEDFRIKKINQVKSLWLNEDFRKEHTERARVQSLERWKNEDYRANQLKHLQSDEIKKKNSESMKRLWSNETYRLKHTELNRIKLNMARNNPDFNQKRLRGIRSENNRLASSERLKKLWEQEDFKIKVSDSAKKQWQNEEFRKKMKESKSQKVILLNNKKVFNSIQDACNFVGLKSISDVTRCCKRMNGHRTAGLYEGIPCRWMYYDEYNMLTEEDKIRVINERYKDKSRPRKVILLNINKIFNSVSEAARYMDGDCRSGITKCCNKKANSAGKINGEPAKWMYYDEYLKQIKE